MGPNRPLDWSTNRPLVWWTPFLSSSISVLTSLAKRETDIDPQADRQREAGKQEHINGVESTGLRAKY